MVINIETHTGQCAGSERHFSRRESSSTPSLQGSGVYAGEEVDGIWKELGAGNEYDQNML